MERILKQKRKTHSEGVTLVETLVYLALFAIIIVTVLEFTITINQKNKVALEKNSIQKASIFLNEHFSDSFSKTDDILEAQTVYNVDNGVLVIDANGTNLTYSISGGQLHFNNGTSTNPVTPSILKISQFRLERINNPLDENVGVKITVTLESAQEQSVNSTFQTSFIE